MFCCFCFVVYIYVYKGKIMGRKLIYITEEDKRKAHSKRSLKYYYKHQDECKKKRMERYYGKKQQKIDN